MVTRTHHPALGTARHDVLTNRLSVPAQASVVLDGLASPAD